MKNSFLEKLLNFYQIDYQDLLNENEQTLDDLPSKDIFKNGKKIADFLFNAIKNSEKILIYGDYDCDGIMSTSIIYKCLANQNYKPGYYIPSREYDGYGLTKDNVDRFFKLGYKIIICVDNGITLNEVVDYANSLGIIVVILDHHQIGEKVPNTEYIMHPEYDAFGSYNISAGAVSFYFSLIYLNRFDEYLFSLATLSLLSDSMPLLAYNHLFVKEGLKIINKNHYKQFFRLLKNSDIPELNEDDLYMQVIPKVNSICRVLNDDKRFNIVKYFIDDNEETTNRLLFWINETNERRKFIVNNIDFNEIKEFDKFIFYVNHENEGIGGLIANKLLSKFNKPSFVFSQNEIDDSIYKGSARSYDGFNIADALNSLDSLLLAHGGHANAGGFTIKKADLSLFEEKMNDIAKDVKVIKKSNYIPLEYNELTLENYDIYCEFSPFGEGHIKPIFKIDHVNINELKKYIYNKHIIYRLNSEASIVLFNYDEEILKADFINLIGTLNLNEFRGNKSVQLIVNDYELIY